MFRPALSASVPPAAPARPVPRPVTQRVARSAALAVFAALALFGAPASAAETLSELRRSWEGGKLWLPEDPRPTAILGDSPERLATWAALHPGAPIVIYMHGCDGLGAIAMRSALFLTRAGYAVAAPDSFARAEKPKSCDPATQESGLHREVLSWRQAELRHALEEIRAIPELAESPIALMGHSEGAITVATVETPADAGSIRARVIEGWTCHAGWPEYQGLNAPEATPVLSLVGAEDPWFPGPPLKGDCGAFMDGNDLSIVYEDPPLAQKHWLTGDPAPQAAVLEFLATHMAD